MHWPGCFGFFTIPSKSVEYSLLAVVDPHLQVSRGQSSRPWDKGGPGLKKKFFWPFGPQFGLKIRGRRGASPGSATDWHILIWEVAMKKVNLMRVHLDWGWGGYKRHYTSHVHYSRTSTKRNAIWTYGVLEWFLKHSNLLPFWHFSWGNFNTTTETSAELENFSYIIRTETVVKRQKMPRKMWHS